MKFKELIAAAEDARKASYSPHSGFSVGAALLCTDGKIFTGCNIENSSYSVTVCAERVALFKAISEGERSFAAIAVVGGKNALEDFCTPCGVCLQALSEFCSPKNFSVVLFDGHEECVYTLVQLLPKGFSLK